MSIVGAQIRAAVRAAEHARDIAPLVHCPLRERDAIRMKLAQSDADPVPRALWRELEERWRGVDAGRPWVEVRR